MIIVSAYFVTSLARGYLLIGIALVALFSVFALVNEADYVGDGFYTLADALVVVVLSAPALLVDLSPFIAMLGTLWGLSILVRNNEVVALRAAGVSSFGIIGVCTLAVLGLSVVLAAVELVARPAHKKASLFRMYQTATDGNPLPESGFWMSRGDYHVNIGSMAKDTGPVDIQIFEFDADHRLRAYKRAAAATVLKSNDWQLSDVISKRFSRSHIETEHVDSGIWTPVWEPQALLVELPLQSFNLVELGRQISASPEHDRDATARQFEFWKRCLAPLSAISFAIFSAAFVLASNPRSGHGARVVVGAFAAILVYLVQQIGTNAALLWGAAPGIAAAIPALGVGLVGLALARRLESP